MHWISTQNGHGRQPHLRSVFWTRYLDTAADPLRYLHFSLSKKHRIWIFSCLLSTLSCFEMIAMAHLKKDYIWAKALDFLCQITRSSIHSQTMIWAWSIKETSASSPGMRYPVSGRFLRFLSILFSEFLQKRILPLKTRFLSFFRNKRLGPACVEDERNRSDVSALHVSTYY